MNFQNVEFITSWFGKDSLNIPVLPEVVITGKSNVGKSTLINRLVNRKSLARTSQTPGKTVSVNYYKVDNRIYLVDLPGYGFAKRSDTQIESWRELTTNYFNLKRPLILFVFLIDIRHDPTENDLIMYRYLKENNYSFIIVATKSDKLNKTELKTRTESLNSFFEKPVIPISSEKNTGIEELKNCIIEAYEGELNK